MLRVFSLVSAIITAAVPFAQAAPVVLKCWTSDGTQLPDWTLDIENRELKFGQVGYGINALNDTYVTAFNSRLDVGGEVIVLNRATGEYRRAGVAMLCTNDSCSSTVLRQWANSGRCQRQQF